MKAAPRCCFITVVPTDCHELRLGFWVSVCVFELRWCNELILCLSITDVRSWGTTKAEQAIKMELHFHIDGICKPTTGEWVPVWLSPTQMTPRCNLIKYKSFGDIHRKWCQPRKKIYELPGGCKVFLVVSAPLFYLLVCALITHNAFWIYCTWYVRRAMNASVPERIKATHSGPLSPVFVASVGD